MTTTPIYAVIRQYREAPIDDSGRRIVSAHSTAEAAEAAKPADVESDAFGGSHWHDVEELTPSPRLAKLLEAGTPGVNALGMYGIVADNRDWLVCQSAEAAKRDAEIWEDPEAVAMWAKCAARSRGLTRSDWEYIEAAIKLTEPVQS